MEFSELVKSIVSLIAAHIIGSILRFLHLLWDILILCWNYIFQPNTLLSYIDRVWLIYLQFVIYITRGR